MAVPSKDDLQDEDPPGKSSSTAVAGVETTTQGGVAVGIFILVGAQLAAASTATCVHALPPATPSVLRGLWRQTLTSMIFAPLAVFVLWRQRTAAVADRREGRHEENAADTGINEENGEATVTREDRDNDSAAPASLSGLSRTLMVLTAVGGAALLNDAVVVALQYASSAAVMCLCNTTPMWLILYSILRCDPQGIVTIAGAAVSLVGAVICATGGDSEGRGGDLSGTALASSSSGEESLGSMIATVGGIGGAMYMTACRKLAPVGLHPVVLTLMINVGMAVASLFICLSTLDGGVSFLSVDITNGFFGFLNPAANPAALFHSVFPDCFGNFGIMLALGFFEPLIVSMVMLTEPLNASVIAMAVVGEPPPSSRTILGVSIVLCGCAVVLWESSKEGKEMDEREKREEEMALLEPEKRVSVVQRRRVSQVVLLSPIGTVAPDVTAKAAWRRPSAVVVGQRRGTLPVSVLRQITMSVREREESILRRSSTDTQFSNHNDSRRSLPSSIIRAITSRLSISGAYGSINAGSIVEEDETEKRGEYIG